MDERIDFMMRRLERLERLVEESLGRRAGPPRGGPDEWRGPPEGDRQRGPRHGGGRGPDQGPRRERGGEGRRGGGDDFEEKRVVDLIVGLTVENLEQRLRRVLDDLRPSLEQLEPQRLVETITREVTFSVEERLGRRIDAALTRFDRPDPKPEDVAGADKAPGEGREEG